MRQLGFPRKDFRGIQVWPNKNIFDKRLNIIKGRSNNPKLSDENVSQKNVTVRAK